MSSNAVYDAELIRELSGMLRYSKIFIKYTLRARGKKHELLWNQNYAPDPEVARRWVADAYDIPINEVICVSAEQASREIGKMRMPSSTSSYRNFSISVDKKKRKCYAST